MRLAIFWPAQIYFDGTRYTTFGFAHLWFSTLGEHFSGVDVIAPVCGSSTRHGSATIETERIRILGLPAVEKGWQRYTIYLPIIIATMLRLLWRYRHQWNRMLVYEVQPLSQVWFVLCQLMRLPVVLYLGGRHEFAILWRARERSFLIRSVVSVWSYWCRLAIPWMVRRVPTVVTGGELRKLYRPVAGRGIYNIISSSVRHGDIVAFSPRRPDPWSDGSIPVVLAVCRVTPIKGLQYLIAALGELAADGRPARLRIAGREDAAYERELLDIASEQGIATEVEFLGSIDPGEALRDLYDHADVFALPSLSEGTPKVVLEAMSRGLPVIASHVGGIPDLVTHDQTGLLVPTGDSHALAQALKRVLSDRDLRERLANRAVAEVRTMTIESQTSLLSVIIKSGPNVEPELRSHP